MVCVPAVLFLIVVRVRRPIRLRIIGVPSPRAPPTRSA
jgi:hypothetical protein